MNMKVTIKLSQSQLRDDAMRKAGISPAQMALKPGTRVERNRKAEAKLGKQKHKAAQYAY